MKLHAFLSIFTFLFSLSSLAEWEAIRNFDGVEFAGRLEYESDSREVKLFYKRKRNWGDYHSFGPLSVSDNGNVDSSLETLDSFFRRQLFSSDVSESILKRVSEFKHLSSVGCQAIYFKNPVSEVENIIEKLTPITESSVLLSGADSASRSLLLEEFETPEGEIQLRMLLDDDENFIKFSLVNSTGDLSDFKVTQKSNGLTLYSSSAQALISIDGDTFNGVSGFITIQSVNDDKIVGSEKTLIQLDKIDKWQISVKGAGFFEQTVIKEGVSLSSTLAEHESIVELQNTDIAFARFDKTKILDLNFIDGEKDKKKLEGFFNSCLAEELSFAQKQGQNINTGSILSEIRSFCYKKTVVESIGLSSHKKVMRTRNCLRKSEILKRSHSGFESLVSELELSDIITKVNQCYSQGKVASEEEGVLSDIEEEAKERWPSLQNDPHFSFVLGLIDEKCSDCAQKAKKVAQVLLLNTATEKPMNEDCLVEEDVMSIHGCALSFYQRAKEEEFLRIFEERVGKDTELARKEVRDCIVSHTSDESDLIALIERDSYYREECLTRAFRPHLTDTIAVRIVDKFSDFGFLLDEAQNRDFVSELKNSAAQILKAKESISDFDTMVSHVVEELDESAFLAFVERVPATLSLKLSDNLVIDSDLQEQGEKLNSDSRLILERVQRNRGQISFKNNLNAFGKEMLMSFVSSDTNLAIKEKILLESAAQEIGSRVNESFEKCFEDFSPSKAYPLKNKWYECEKERKANISLELLRRELSQVVSQHFDLSSEKANDILAPLDSFERCAQKNSRNVSLSLDHYEKHLNGCKLLAEFDLSFNMARARQDEYFPFMEEGNEYQDKLNACYEKLLNSVDINRGEYTGQIRSLMDFKKSLQRGSPYSNSLLNVFIPSLNVETDYYHGDKASVEAMVSALGEVGSEWNDELSACESTAEIEVANAFRDYMIKKIPSLEISGHGNQYEAVMRDFLDGEIVELILSLKDKVSNSDGGILTIKNFVDTLSELIDDGFVYDKVATKTELIVFKNEFKSFLRWANKNPKGFSLNDASDFFKESELSEHLSLAVLSQKTYQSFERGFDEMKKDQLDDLYTRAGCSVTESYSCLSEGEKETYRRIRRKYANLKRHAKKMTSSYDFRRIMRPDSPQGEKMLKQIRELYLKPKIMGIGVSQRDEEVVMSLVGKAILKDSTDGGFADLFVQEAARFQLEEEKASRWAITEFFFYDDEDFNWDVLKETESGRRAISYYSRYIMLPKFMDQQQSRTARRVRMEQFRRLLTVAQGENSL